MSDNIFSLYQAAQEQAFQELEQQLLETKDYERLSILKSLREVKSK